MKRRSIVAAATASWLPLPRAQAQAPTLQRPARIGWPASVPITRWPLYAVFTEAMRERGWIEGTHYVVDEAIYDGRSERIAEAVAEVLKRKPDLLIGSGTPPMRALMKATSTISIVMFAVGDPVEQGFVASLARPGGNVTGVATVGRAMGGKQIELLMQAAPHARRIGLVFNPDLPPHVTDLPSVEAAALRQGVLLRPVELRSPEGIDAAVAVLQRERVEAVHILPQPFMNTGGHVARLAELALQHRWPTALVDVAHVRAGILVSYGWKTEDMVRRLPHYVIRILEGTPPADLAVEQPTRFYVGLNLKTAKALGLTLPPSLLLRADEVIQ